MHVHKGDAGFSYSAESTLYFNPPTHHPARTLNISYYEIDSL